MKIEEGTACGVPSYWTVRVNAGEVRPGDPPAWLGTIMPSSDGKTVQIRVWVPACGVRREREYKKLAKELLVAAAKSKGFTP